MVCKKYTDCWYNVYDKPPPNNGFQYHSKVPQDKPNLPKYNHEAQEAHLYL